MSKRTIIFGGINGLDAFDLYVDTIEKKPPEKRESRVSVPYKSGSYNMNKILGYPIYGDREIVYTCQLIAESSTELDKIVTKINQWLLTGVESVLQDTGTPDYHYLMECISVIPASNERGYCELTITFKGYPFKIWNTNVSEQKWDDINFEVDKLHEYTFNARTGGDFIIYNESPTPVSLHCELITASSVTINVAGLTKTINKDGKTDIVLIPGENKITITGGSGADSNSMVRFGYYKEEL